MTPRWIAGVVGAVGLATLLIVAVFHFATSEHRTDESKQQIDALRENTRNAHALWESDKRAEAIKQYKQILRSPNRIHLHDDLPMLYRRIIEYEADYGDPSDARDWSLRAYEEWPGMPMRLTFDSRKATEIWNDVTAAGEERKAR